MRGVVTAFAEAAYYITDADLTALVSKESVAYQVQRAAPELAEYIARRKVKTMFCNNNNSCIWIIIILLIIFFGCGNNGCGCGNDNGCGCGCN